MPVTKTAKSATASDAALNEFWDRWIAVIGQVAEGHAAWRCISAQEYSQLRAELLTACRARIQQADKLERPFFEQMNAIVDPWVNIDAISNANIRLMIDLAQECENLNTVFRGKKRSRVRRKSKGGFKLVLFTVAIGIGLGALYLNRGDAGFSLAPVFYDGLRLWHRARVLTSKQDDIVTFGVIAAFIIPVGCWLLYSTKKS